MSKSDNDVRVNPNDRGINIWTLGISWTLTPIAIVAVCVRFYLRRAFAGGWESHDWIMLAALIVQIFYQVGLTIMCYWGGGKPLQNLTALESTMVEKWSWIIAPATHLIALLARISITILLIRIFGTKLWFKRYLIIFTTIQSIVSLAVIIIALAQCQPYELNWNPSLPGIRWDFGIYGWTAIASISLYCISDITFIFFPILIISKLNMNTSRKVGVSLLIAVSIITVAAAAGRLTIALLQMTGETASMGPNWQYIDGIINFAACIEQDLVIIMGCVPILNTITKLDLPRFSRMRNLIGSLISSVRNGGSSFGRPFASRTYQNLELIPSSHTSDIESLAPEARPIRDKFLDAHEKEHCIIEVNR
ncbi:hypothetical protein F4774DRAFT_428504 [Daldinia eschscholtzii]|nr:hypothetical protein F4774DRAFT_428504 [Daldinia eschscholtzii]